MTTHVDETLLAHRDEARDEATALYLSEHLRGCAECRELERQVGRADLLLALPEDGLTLPPRRSYEPQRRISIAGAALPAAAVVLVVIGALLTGSVLRSAREDGSLAGRPSAGGAGTPSASAAAPGTFAGIDLGMSGSDVRRVLGDPDSLSPIGVQWKYDRGLTLHFRAGPVDDPVELVSILGSATSGLRTLEGFAVGGTEAEFLSTYRPLVIEREDDSDEVVRTYWASGADRTGRTVLIRAAFDTSDRAIELVVLRDDGRLFIRLPMVVAPRPSPSAAVPVVVGPYQADLGWRGALETDVRSRSAQLAFDVLVPDHATFPVRAVVTLLRSCGASESPCIEIRWIVPNAWVEIVQGPGGCCFDLARPDAVRDIEIRGGVFAQLIPLGREAGGPILWWSEQTSTGRTTYVAISGPLLDRDELVKIARSMRPLAP